MKNLEKLTNIIESIIFVSGEKIAVQDIADKLGVSKDVVLKHAKILQEKYSNDSGIQLLIFNNKLQFCSNPKYELEVSSVLNPIKEKELSKTMLEVAAIIAYKQPITRIDIEEIRGSGSEYAVQKLLDLKMIEPVGRKDAVGRPVLFATTDEFLKRFQISSINDLPDYEELINSINLLKTPDDNDDYLYKKDVYVHGEVATTLDEKNNQEKSNDNKIENVTHNEEIEQDFDLPDIDEEEIPDYLIGEDVERI